MTEETKQQINWISTNGIYILATILILTIVIYYLVIPIVNLFHPVHIADLPHDFWTLVEATVPTALLHQHMPAVLSKFISKEE